ncbi:MAG: hypothetical protein E3J56_13140 [Candidatus Aminicenantes bacterium]|nr:MAG: hypothetical protein E3J56_13140 [Candidatus Aminicenantes bacterium]
MTDLKMPVSEESWKALDKDEQSWFIFATLRSFDKRLEHLEGRKLLDKGLTVAGGIIGGALAFLGLKVWR